MDRTANRLPGLTIRLAESKDLPELERLRQLDSAQPLRGRVMIASHGEAAAVAAISLDSGEVVADPFVPTADTVSLLRVRRHQLAPARRPGWSRVIPRVAKDRTLDGGPLGSPA